MDRFAVRPFQRLYDLLDVLHVLVYSSWFQTASAHRLDGEIIHECEWKITDWQSETEAGQLDIVAGLLTE